MKKALSWFFKVVTFVAAVVYFVSCFTPYISPVIFWPMAFLALGFPYLACVIIFLASAWLFINRRIAVGLGLLLLVGFQNLSATFAPHFNSGQYKRHKKQPGALRIMTWNVRGFDNPTIAMDSSTSVRSRMFEFVKSADADVLCLQEFTEAIGNGFYSNTEELVHLGYQYYYKTNERKLFLSYGTFFFGTAIFSKVPLLDSGKTMLGDPSEPEHIAYVDLKLQQKVLRIFSMHLKSLNLFTQPKASDDIIPFHYDSNFIYQSTKFEKLKVFAQDHAREVLIARPQVDHSSYPLVLTADMNSVPTSYAYHVMSNGLQDAFLKKGWGLGTTMTDSLPKTLRIDLMLVDKKLDIKQYLRDNVNLSDHYPQIIDVMWKQ